jgi:broad specificity phosphatase PhoE
MGKFETTFYIVRHGQTDWNIQGITQGQTDIPLNEKGKLQAQEVARKLHNIHFDAAFSSDLARAYETAEIISLEKQLTLMTHKALRERNYGSLEGRKWTEYQEELREELKNFETLSEHEKKLHKLVPGMESEEEVITRLLTYLRELAVAYSSKNILIVSHGYVMLTLLIHLGFGTHQELPPDSIKNTAYITLKSDGVDFILQEVVGVEKRSLNQD